MDQLDSDDVLAAEESGGLDAATWSEHDASLFRLVDSELDSYWNSFDPFEGAEVADDDGQCPATGALLGRQTGVKRLSSLSPPPPQHHHYQHHHHHHHHHQQQQQQSSVPNSGRKRPRDCSISPVLQRSCADVVEQSSSSLSSGDAERQRTPPAAMSAAGAPTRPTTLHPSTSDAAAESSDGSLGIPLGGLLSSLPPNCSVYITHRPASTSGQSSPSPVMQIIIDRARPPSTVPPLPSPNPPYCMPSLLPLPPSPLATTVDQFHPLDDVRLRQPACPRAPLSRHNAPPLTTAVRPPKSLSTYAAEFHRRVGDVSTWRYETGGRRASDSAAAVTLNSASGGDADARPDRCRHGSSTLLPTTSAGTTSSAVQRLPVNRFQRPTSLSLATAPPLSVFRPATPNSQSPSVSRRPLRDDSTDGGAARGSCFDEESTTADNGSGSDVAACYMLSDAVHRRHVGSSSSSSSSSPLSIVNAADSHADLPSPLPSTDAAAAAAAAASAKPQQRTIDALSRKIRRNRTKNTDKPASVVGSDAAATSFPRPDSSCPTPPLSTRQLTPTSAFSPTSLSPFDAAEQSSSGAAGYDETSQRRVLLTTDYADAGNTPATDDDGSKTLLADDPMMMPSRRKTGGRRKSQASRQSSASDVEKVIMIASTFELYAAFASFIPSHLI